MIVCAFKANSPDNIGHVQGKECMKMAFEICHEVKDNRHNMIEYKKGYSLRVYSLITQVAEQSDR